MGTRFLLSAWHLGHNEGGQSSLQFVPANFRFGTCRGTMLEHQAEFENALRGGREMRERLFDTMERCYAHDFGNGRAGKRFYERLLSAVRAAGSPEATGEFETRFSPFLNPDKKHLNADDVGHLEAIGGPPNYLQLQADQRPTEGRLLDGRPGYGAAFVARGLGGAPYRCNLSNLCRSIQGRPQQRLGGLGGR